MKKFNCLCCGDCCSGEMNIKLNLYDLYKMSKHLKLTSTKELFDKNILSLEIGQNGIKVPQIVFKKVPYKFCPFLINDLNEQMELKGFCSLHPYIKPLVCILAPISKVYDADYKSSSYSFTKPTENCPGTLTGKDIPIDIITKPVALEIEYENKFYEILNIIALKSIENYEERLYFFDIDNPFSKTIDNIRRIYEKT